MLTCYKSLQSLLFTTELWLVMEILLALHRGAQLNTSPSGNGLCFHTADAAKVCGCKALTQNIETA